MKDFIRRFDFFPKVSEAVNTKQTAQGGIIFSGFFMIMIALCCIEVYTLILGDPITEPYIEIPDLEDKTRVNLNISLYDVPCEALSLDYQDITGTHFEDMEQSMFKLHLDSNGWVIDEKDLQAVRKFESKNFHPSVPLWDSIVGTEEEYSCYGAELYKGQKCYTCQDVQNAYLQRGWPVPPVETIKQCTSSGKRLLMQEMTYTDMSENKTILNKKAEGFYFENNLYAVTNLKANHMFTFDLIRNQCENEDSVQLAFEYMGAESNTTETKDAKPLFFKRGECRKRFPLRVVSFDENEKKLTLESFLLEDKLLNTLVQDKKLFKLVLKGSSSFADFVMTEADPVSKRMLHAEFYGFDDRQPTIVTAQEINYFEAVMGRGCQIVGTMFLKQVPGNFHISTHHNGLALQYIQKGITARHKIHFLEFTREEDSVTEGKYGPKIKTNFLDGTLVNPPVGHDVEYYLKIVGSKLEHPFWGEKSFYEFVAHANVVPHERNVVLIQFKYEFDPVSMRYTDGRRSLSRFFVSLLAIIGGIFATSTLLDKIFG